MPLTARRGGYSQTPKGVSLSEQPHPHLLFEHTVFLRSIVETPTSNNCPEKDRLPCSYSANRGMWAMVVYTGQVVLAYQTILCFLPSCPSLLTKYINPLTTRLWTLKKQNNNKTKLSRTESEIETKTKNNNYINILTT